MGPSMASLGLRTPACFPSAPVRQRDSKLFLLSLNTKINVSDFDDVLCYLIWKDTHTVSEALICNVASQASC